MNTVGTCIIKRDGKREDFSSDKISNAIRKAFLATGMENREKQIESITRNVVKRIAKPTIGVEEIQDMVETELMKDQPEVAKSTSSTANGETPNVSGKRKSNTSWTASWLSTKMT